jgi:hypothetical protein
MPTQPQGISVIKHGYVSTFIPLCEEHLAAAEWLALLFRIWNILVWRDTANGS